MTSASASSKFLQKALQQNTLILPDSPSSPSPHPHPHPHPHTKNNNPSKRSNNLPTESNNRISSNASQSSNSSGSRLLLQQLKQELHVTEDVLQSYVDAFHLFPLNRNHLLTVDSLVEYYASLEIEMSREDCAKSIELFLQGEKMTRGGGVNLETFIRRMHQWMQNDVHNEDVYRHLLTGLNPHGISLEDIEHLLIHLNEEENLTLEDKLMLSFDANAPRLEDATGSPHASSEAT